MAERIIRITGNGKVKVCPDTYVLVHCQGNPEFEI